jgi:hypothetical protein
MSERAALSRSLGCTSAMMLETGKSLTF